MIRLTSISPIIIKQRFVVFLSAGMLLLPGKLLAQAPAITTISPVSAAVGATITITGTNFNTTPANNVVFFGSVKATAVTADGTGTSLTVVVPAGAVYGPVNVLNTATRLSATSPRFFTPVFSPNKPGLISADVTVQGIAIDAGISSRVYSVGANDLNNDGKPDLVMTSGATGDNKVHIRSNTSNTTSVSFAPAISITVAGGLLRPDGQLSFGDLDGDTRPDVVVPGNEANAFVVLRNNGALSFSSIIVSSGSNTTGSVVSDLDLDGKPDITVSNYGSSSIVAYPNTTVTPGAVTLGTGITFTGAPFQAVQLVAADLDGDGKPEMISPQLSSYSIHYYKNTSTPGSISFNARQTIDVFPSFPDHNASSIAAADLNNDGKPDLVVTDGNNVNANSIAILRNTSSGGAISFSITTQQIGTTPYNQGFASFADMNGDGKPDLVLTLDKDFLTPGSKYRIAVMNNTSEGNNISFSSPIEYAVGDAAMGYSSIASDLNGDGLPDILAPLGNAGNLAIFRGSPQFAPTISSLSSMSAAPGTSLVITGTGFAPATNGNTVRFGTVTAAVTTASSTSLTVTVPQNASHAPISVLNKNNTLSVSSVTNFLPVFTPNKSTLKATDFTEQGNFSVTGSLYGMVAGDLTGDGKPELVITNASNTGTLIMLPNTSTAGGAVSFGSATVITPTGGTFAQPRYAALGDLDGNGWLDIAAAAYNSNTVTVFLNSGTGILSTAITQTGTFTTDLGPVGVAIGDLDGDGKPELVTSNNFGLSVSVFRNISTDIGAVSFAAKQDYQVSVSNAVYNLALADIDNDGKLDIIAGKDINSNPGKVVLLRNTSTVGSISFTPTVEVDGPRAPWNFVPGDLNSDGLTDFVASAGGSAANQIFAYTKLSSGGAMTDLGITQINTTVGNIAINLGDINGDGKPDLVSGTRTAIGGNHYTFLYPNTTTGTNTSFGTRIELPAPGLLICWNAVTTDMNADGRPDILMGRQVTGTSAITVYRNTLIAPPSTQSTGITVTSLTGTTATFSWTNGNGSKRALFIKQDNTGTAAPVAETDYTANTAFGSGSQVGSTGWYCVYNGTGTTVNVTGFTPAATYRVMVTEFNDGGLSNTAQYNTNIAGSNPVTLTTLATVIAISRTAAATINTAAAGFSVTFNATMTNLSPSNFSLTTSGVTGASVTSVTGSGTTFTVTVNTGTGNGTIRLNLANTTGMAPGVTNTLPYTGEVYTIDKTPPTLSPVTIASGNSHTSKATTGDAVTVTFTSSKTISTPTVTIAGNTVTSMNTTGNIWSATYTMTGSDAEGNVPFNIVFSDLVGNAGTPVSTTTNSSSVVFDRTVPSLTTVTITSNNNNTSLALQGNTVTLNFTSDEPINTPVVTMAGHTVIATNTGGNNWTATYTIAGSDVEGAVSFGIAFSDVTGNAGAMVTATTNSSGVVFDKTIPTLNNAAIVSNNANTSRAKVGDLITLSFTANEVIQAPVVSIATHTITAVNVSANTWSASYTMTAGDAEGTVPFSITCYDMAGNAGAVITTSTNSSSVVFDKTLPVLTDVGIISGNVHPAWAKKADVITLTFISSETIATPTVTLATHAVAVSNTGNNNWIASYTMTTIDTEGAVPFSIAFTDITSNTGVTVTGTSDNSNVVYDTTAPLLQPVTMISSSPIAGIALPGNTVTITFTANETILSPTVMIASHSVSATASTGNDWSAAYTMLVSDTEGLVPFSIPVADLAGNTTVVSTTTDNSTVNFRRSEGPFFTNGTSQLLTVCQDINTAINNLLAVTYVQTGKPLTITVTGMPSHGTLSGFDAALVSNGSTVLPSGLGYQPATGYAGTDVFTAMVTDGTFTSTTTINVTVSTTPSGSITATGGTALCEGATLVLTGTGGNSYKWYQDGMLINNNSTSQLTVTETGIYTAILVSAAGCEAAAAGTVTVTLIRKPQVDFTIGSNSCINIPVPFTNTSAWTGSGAVNHLWNDGKGGTGTAISPSFTYTQTGSYNVKLTITPQLCPALADSITKTVTITQALSGIRNPTMDIAKNEPTKLVIRTIPNASYQWTPARFLLTTNIPDPVTIASAEQEYQVALTLPSGCTTVDTLLVRLHENTTAYVPNVFSPNGDGQNDRLMPNLVGLKQLNFFRVFNKWGKMLFETTNMGQGWDGKYNGVLQPLDTYTWSIQGYDANGNMIKRQGSVTLLK